MPQCPKCGADVADGAGQCPSCGVAFVRLPVVPPPPPPPMPTPSQPARSGREKQQWFIACAVLGGCAVLAIPIFGAILFPVFAKAREKARQTACLANVRQISLAMLSYEQDNDQCFPPRPGGVSSAPAAGSNSPYPADDWRTQLLPYVRQSEVFMCPTRHQPDSYEFNDELYGLRLESIKGPERTLGVFEKGYPSGSPPPPHNRGYNIGFADGHCRWVSGYEGTPGRP